jgi:chromosome segregation ATPase
LRAAETQLGLLGWQQADFADAPARAAAAIAALEKEQLDLLNRAADSRREADVRAEARAAEASNEAGARDAFAAECAAAEARAAELRAERDQTEALLARFRATLPEIDARIEDVKLQSRLAIGAGENDEALRLRLDVGDRLRTKQREREAIEERIGELLVRRKSLGDAAAAEESRLANLRSSLGHLAARSDEHERAAKAIAVRLDAEHKAAERAIQAREQAKAGDYAAIGRALADAGIAPMNQPNALQKVVDLRATLARLDARRADAVARARARAHSPLALAAFLATLAAAAALVLAFVR